MRHVRSMSVLPLAYFHRYVNYERACDVLLLQDFPKKEKKRTKIHDFYRQSKSIRAHKEKKEASKFNTRVNLSLSNSNEQRFIYLAVIILPQIIKIVQTLLRQFFEARY